MSIPPDTVPLLSSSSPVLKGKCWCCWEITETFHDPLIRVCRGCKDPDLQYIHQSCIDRYMTLLPSHSNINSFYCTRCKDPYRLETKSLHPLKSLYRDRYLFNSIMVITLCMIILSICCITLIVQHMDTFIFSIPVWFFAGFMLFACHIVNTLAWLLVLKQHSGRSEIHVLSIQE